MASTERVPGGHGLARRLNAYGPPAGYTVNPAANGAHVTGGPALLWTNENREPEGEITSPVSMMREIVRSESGGGGTTVHMAPGAVVINVGPNDDPRKAGADAWAGFEQKMRESGRVMAG
jgi:hypothetical protein